ncbi:MAG: hypothetical protein LBN32_02105, partial [Helicobacteraceae bacterium]|nr:hypothetical protein [Helicobacteraceae bacterium]
MAIKQFWLLAISALFGAFVFSGCATTAYYETETDPNYTIKKSERFLILRTEDKQPSIEDKNFAALLKT